MLHFANISIAPAAHVIDRLRDGGTRTIHDLLVATISFTREFCAARVLCQVVFWMGETQNRSTPPLNVQRLSSAIRIQEHVDCSCGGEYIRNRSL